MNTQTKRKPSFSAPSSSSPPAKRFDVFLSFRGEDTRNTFTSHLYRALSRIGLFAIFKDDHALDKGKDIGPELMSAIEDSEYAVVVLSENYATSTWCLTEVAKIVECMGDSGRIRTIFYHVNPSQVRNVISTDSKMQQESSFWKALEEHAKSPRHWYLVESWRTALAKVASQSGHPVEDHTDEAIFIEEFVANISRELGASIRPIEGLFGMSSRLKQLHSYVLRSMHSQNVCFIGIHGMGGIGKSTLARLYYKQMSHKFDGRSSFLQNIREVCEKKENGLVHLQKQLLSDILKGDFAQIAQVDDGKDMIRSRLRYMKVLVVLDDVSELEQLNALAEHHKWFVSGSIIIITTREDSFLKLKRHKIYRAKYLNHTEALQLFSWKAFQSLEPPKEYKELSEQIVGYASYLPLALTVLGSLLGGKKRSVWESALCRLRKFPEEGIVKKLKISFDDLSEIDQRIFLDIACFFNGYDIDNVIEILDSCDFDSEYGISNLIGKSLLSIQHGNKLWMHDLLQQMGKEIVRKESGNELGRQSRIWNAVDLYHILKNNEGTNNVEAIVVTFGKGPTTLSFEGFSCLKRLRLLKISGHYNFSGEDDEPKIVYLSNDLRCLEWNRFPYNKFPSSFQPDRLVKLELCNSSIEQLWNNHIKEPFYNLKVIELTFSASFTKFEDYKLVPNLERLNLEGCTKLTEIHQSVKQLKKLLLLNLNFCTSLENIPEEINSLTSLQILNLYGCSKIRKLPDNLEQLNSLRNLDIRSTGLSHIPSSIFLLENLESLSCSHDKEMVAQSALRVNIMNHASIGKWFWLGNFCASLTRLDLIGCNITGEAFPEDFGKLVWLTHLDLSKNPFSTLPTGINRLPELRSLKLEYCDRLRCLEPELLPQSLEEIHVNYCTSLSSFLDPLKPCHIPFSAYCLDCTELVKRQNGMKTALVSLMRFIEGPPYPIRRFNIVLPLHPPSTGHELPAWFSKRSSTASLSVRLDPDWCNNHKLLGFALAVRFGPNSSGNRFSFVVGTDHGKYKNVMIGDTIHLMSGSSDHLFLYFMHHRELLQRGVGSSVRCDDQLIFSFYAHDACSCGPCGFRLVYEEDMQELYKITSRFNNESPDEQKEHVHSLRSKR